MMSDFYGVFNVSTNTILNFSIQVTAELKHYDKCIIECTWDGKAWKFLRLREDKSFPNALKTAQSKPLVF